MFRKAFAISLLATVFLVLDIPLSFLVGHILWKCVAPYPPISIPLNFTYTGHPLLFTSEFLGINETRAGALALVPFAPYNSATDFVKGCLVRRGIAAPSHLRLIDEESVDCGQSTSFSLIFSFIKLSLKTIFWLPYTIASFLFTRSPYNPDPWSRQIHERGVLATTVLRFKHFRLDEDQPIVARPAALPQDNFPKGAHWWKSSAYMSMATIDMINQNCELTKMVQRAYLVPRTRRLWEAVDTVMSFFPVIRRFRPGALDEGNVNFGLLNLKNLAMVRLTLDPPLPIEASELLLSFDSGWLANRIRNRGLRFALVIGVGIGLVQTVLLTIFLLIALTSLHVSPTGMR